MSNKLLFPLLLVPAMAAASGPVDSEALAKAETVLKHADERLSSAGSLRAVYVETDEYPGEYRDLRQTATVTLSRPNGVRVEITRARRVKASDPWKNSGNDTLAISDGQSAYSVFFHPHSTQVRAIEPSKACDLSEAPILSGFFGAGGSPAQQLERGKAGGELDSIGVSGSTVTYKVGQIERTVEIGPDGLVHRLVAHNAKNNASRTWVLQSVSLNPSVPTAAFRYSVPKDALPFPPAERSAGIEVGSQSPDFEVVSAANKPVRLGDFKGKVVVLEFWATWCWPCNQSIPETQRLVSTYRDRGVEGFLVSIKDSRKGFDAWVKKHPQFAQLAFAFDDPVHGQAYEAFLHPSNPTLYVIGRDGRVVARFEGYTGPNPAVEKAIAASL